MISTIALQPPIPMRTQILKIGDALAREEIDYPLESEALEEPDSRTCVGPYF
jgi:hypothetical protein